MRDALIVAIVQQSMADFLRRLVAYWVDGLVMVIPAVILNLMLFIAIMRDSSGLGILGVILLSFALGFLYFGFFESSRFQGTPGKIALGIKVVDSNLQQISFGNALVRIFGRIICFFTLYIGFIMIAFTEKNQGLHDIIAKTYVIHR